MVIIQHPSEPNENEPAKHSGVVEFGGRSDGGRGYLSHSQRVGPSVLLLHEWFGLQEAFTNYADRFRDEGFTVLAPDLYDGYIASTVEEAETKMKATDADEKTMKRVRAAANFLTENWHPRLGVVGFSMGAAYAAMLASSHPVEATVIYYSAWPGEDPANWSGPALAHFAENDEFEPKEDCEAFVTTLADNGVEVEGHFYPGTGHWFANSSAPRGYDPEAAELAFQRTVEFFRHHLA